ncbi:MAG: DUF1549 domain-containing protein, partial [Planctomycetes bacterium]|nr:DUF1549 domain-containing protein [Planctomycetota bacterium]
ARHPIDRFVEQRLESERLPTSPEANKTTLIRRVTLDLIGIPPTLEDVDDFLSDKSPDAYERVVDRLLASPRYGERMVLDWLDAARYADTNGYQGDGTRTMWPWREWAINALNENKPFDQFTIEQLAGDLIPNGTLDQKIATGFHRNHPLNGEGGRIAEESRVEYVMDRVETTGTVWLGLTIGCCRCHDHKYDPFTQKEYYQLSAYFNSIAETGAVDRSGNANPVERVLTKDNEQRLEELAKDVQLAESNLKASLPAIDEAQKEWEKSPAGTADWTVLNPTSVSAKNGTTLTVQSDGAVLTSGDVPPTDDYDLVFQMNGVFKPDANGLTALRIEALSDPSLPEQGPGRSTDSGAFLLSAVSLEVGSTTDPNLKQKVSFLKADADFNQTGFDADGLFDTNKATGWSSLGASKGENRVVVLVLADTLNLTNESNLRLSLKHESDQPKHTLGKFRVSFTTASSPRLPNPPLAIQNVLQIATEKRDDAQKKAIQDYFRKYV